MTAEQQAFLLGYMAKEAGYWKDFREGAGALGGELAQGAAGIFGLNTPSFTQGGKSLYMRGPTAEELAETRRIVLPWHEGGMGLGLTTPTGAEAQAAAQAGAAYATPPAQRSHAQRMLEAGRKGEEMMGQIQPVVNRVQNIPAMIDKYKGLAGLYAASLPLLLGGNLLATLSQRQAPYPQMPIPQFQPRQMPQAWQQYAMRM